ncbi:MAG: threonine--tRNA ligase [Candidatus Yanofskybacteria bacterium RIFCSPHIGHO2_01_FULL_45_42]|uniref:Threonine--tRNA ligase n=2 Tax=Candidatus Yanofskyibacteriota TaxID=1752733 RepID=A0A1F8FN09_9BACT|nr:MAG: threonine--tRNA ligase [Candidatus Yanofskybacteria bacterium RIFCSPHIGHO2_01_FULL_45_42]OGN13856.1 MAG: threonine--tRNA ligase [Candidatus Yanofskybacteria bacterium RIFCSPHIGHO2_02_FULL_43_22]
MKYSLEHLRHSLAHLLGAAVLELYPGSKLAIGPAIDGGFYYDIDAVGKISDADLSRIEAEMRKILKTWDKFEGREVDADEARKFFKGNPYKEELISELENKGEKITLYVSGGFTDLCRGGHAARTRNINPEAFKLSHVAGAYWRGDEKNPQLTRIYGFAFATKKELDDHITILEEAKKRDHKKLGAELDLFTFSELVGSGLPLWTPKGTLLRDILDNFVWELRKEVGYERVDIPHITKKDLYEKSGHWDKFKDELFKITTREGHLFAMKPMNCPHHAQIYARKPHSYRELPQRYASTTKVYRDEQSGELSGLSRVRSITQDDAHVFCRITQVKDEIQKIWDIVRVFYETLDLKLELHLSLRDPNCPEKYLGNKEHWNKAERILREVAKENKTPYIEALGDAAFYAPKLDFMATDSLGREWQVATIQIDVHMPESFDLSCANEKSEKERIVMLHAAIMGSIERFLSVIIEHFAGAFPVWLSPVQATVLPITEKQNKWAENVRDKLKEAGIRTEVDLDNETLGKKIRQAELQKVPYVLIVGEKEVRAKAVAVRQRGKGDIGQTKLDEFVLKIQKEISKKAP